MKKLLYIIPILLIGFTGCENVDFGDTNVDRDAVTTADAQGLMAGSMNRFFGLAGRTYLGNPTLYVQYQSQNVYTDEQRYNEAPAPWGAYYVQTLSNLKTIVDLNSVDEVDDLTITYGAPANQIGVAQLMSAVIWKRLTDTWGPVPYKDALGDKDLTPEYVDQETIYKDLISQVKTARDMLDASLPGPTGDVVYGGDVTKWKKFANSFILSLTMQLSKQYPNAGAYPAQEFSNALNHSAGVIEDVSDEFVYHHANAPGATNPFSAFRPADYSLSEPFVDALKGDAGTTNTITYSNTTYDERLEVFATNASLDGRPYGQASTDGGTYAGMSENFRNPDSPLVYMSAAYTYLNRAEAAQRGWTGEIAVDMFEMGVNKSYESIDAHYVGDGSLESAASGYVTARLVDFASVGALQVIAEEKWVALYPMGFDAWSEWRRTGVPGLIPSAFPLNNGDIPRRYIYPSEEAGVNTQSYNNALPKLSPATDNNTSRFWWDM